MSEAKDIPVPSTQAINNAVLAGSPLVNKFLIPSPIPHRRNRTYSASEAALAGPTKNGLVKSFCRQKGHGFITPLAANEGDQELFFHISDIDGEYVPKPGDHVSYKTCLIPPKKEKYQAVHVQITDLKKGVSHEKWDSPVSSPDK
ncbi:cold shock domain-containing protein CG9705 [Patella vulgata]|uniref:cold shock domain-containing protein CG9705 n=1 Tax=Patella vulgata TaxID=6465 RepID=UPI0021804D5F|nr:cold shock domain-containing protein CG9705 [Patella vulgata]